MGVREKQEKNLKPKGDLGFLGVGFSPRVSPKSTSEFGAQSWPKRAGCKETTKEVESSLGNRVLEPSGGRILEKFW